MLIKCTGSFLAQSVPNSDKSSIIQESRMLLEDLRLNSLLLHDNLFHPGGQKVHVDPSDMDDHDLEVSLGNEVGGASVNDAELAVSRQAQ